jgi:predicted nucleic acid-binding protein
MAALIVPPGVVYVDAQIMIYTVERHPLYAPLLLPLWQAAAGGRTQVITSELTLMETLVLPMRNGDAALQADYRRVLSGAELRLIAVTRPVLLEAAQLRARTVSLRTPDAIHAATGMLEGCASFVSNDRGLRQVPGLPLVLLDDVLHS